MNTDNKALVGGLVGLIVGLLVGYWFGQVGGANTFFMNDRMWSEMEEHMDDTFVEHDEVGDHMMDWSDDPLIENDGAMQHAMDEMMLVTRGKTGEAYEEAFLRAMIVHHIGAIEMAKEMKTQTDRPELKTMADDIIQTQTAEVETMRGWLHDWYNVDVN